MRVRLSAVCIESEYTAVCVCCVCFRLRRNHNKLSPRALMIEADAL